MIGTDVRLDCVFYYFIDAFFVKLRDATDVLTDAILTLFVPIFRQ